MSNEKELEPIIVNGKQYPLWEQFVQKQDEWIGGRLEDSGDSMDKAMGAKPMSTEITGIELRSNGKESAFFEVTGKDFTCGFDVKSGGVVGGEEGWLTFSGYMSHSWRIAKPKKEED